MSDIADDDELLNADGDEFDSADPDLEDVDAINALLQDEYDTGNLQDEDYVKSDNVNDSYKKESASEVDEPEEDVLELDYEAEEEFQDPDASFEEEQKKRKDGKFSVERSSSTSTATTTTTITKVPPRTTQFAKKTFPNTKTTSINNNPKAQDIKKSPPRIIDRRRGGGRGNSHSRQNFRNNIQKDRRPERRKVYINPKYEGIVHIKDNNARLAWDNQNYPQNNQRYIQPWALGNATVNCELNFQDPSQLLNNLVSGIATNISQSPNLFQLTPVQSTQNQNFFEPPPVYQPFQPSLGVQNSQQPYSNQNQVSGRQPFQPQLPPLQSCPPVGSQQFNNPPPPIARMQNEPKSFGSYTNYEYYDRQNNQQNYPLNSKKPYVPTNFENRNINDNKSNFPKFDDFQNKSSNYPNDSYSNRNVQATGNFIKPGDYRNQNFSNYNNSNDNRNFNRREEFKPAYNDRNPNTVSYGNKNFTPAPYETRNFVNKEDFKQDYTNRNSNFRTNTNHNYNNFYKNDYRQEITQNKKFPNQGRNFQSSNTNLMGPGNRRTISSVDSDIQINLPAKKIREDDSASGTHEENNGESKKPTITIKQETSVTVTNKTSMEQEEEDEETRLYRLKIEEQKKEREKVLRMKEERRKMMLQQQKREEEENAPGKINQQPPVANIVVKSTIPATTNFQKTTNLRTGPGFSHQKRNYHQQMSNNIPVLSVPNRSQNYNNATSSTEDELSKFTFKISNDLEKNVQKNIPKTEQSSSGFMSNRVVVVKNSNNNQKSGGALPNVIMVTNEASNESAEVGQGLSSFFNNRKVLKKDNSLIHTRLVVINNLSASTTENKLVAMTRGIGEIQKLRMDKQERQATILFKSVASAHAFFKKFQRHMLDLSMIEVKLESMI